MRKLSSPLAVGGAPIIKARQVWAGVARLGLGCAKRQDACDLNLPAARVAALLHNLKVVTRVEIDGPGKYSTAGGRGWHHLSFCIQSTPRHTYQAMESGHHCSYNRSGVWLIVLFYKSYTTCWKSYDN